MCASSCWKRLTRVSPVRAPDSSLRWRTPKSAILSGSSLHERGRWSNIKLKQGRRYSTLVSDTQWSGIALSEPQLKRSGSKQTLECPEHGHCTIYQYICISVFKFYPLTPRKSVHPSAAAGCLFLSHQGLCRITDHHLTGRTEVLGPG